MLEGGWEEKVRSEGARAGGEAVPGQVGPQALVDLAFPPKINGEPLEGVEQSRGVSSVSSFKGAALAAGRKWMGGR